MPLYLLDTNVCIGIMRGHEVVTQRLRGLERADLVISSITAYELWLGVEKAKHTDRERARVEGLFSLVSWVDFDLAAAKRAASIRAHLESKGQVIGPYDTLIAAHALALGLTLITQNTKEFKRVPGLKVVDWLK
jgi:tRNA(fMet)-specific endonuclease VapC